MASPGSLHQLPITFLGISLETEHTRVGCTYHLDTVLVGTAHSYMQNMEKQNVRARKTMEEHREAGECKRRAECPPGRRRAERLVGVRRVSADGDETPGHATRRQVIAGVLVPRGVRAGTDARRTRAAEGNGYRPIVCT